MWSDGRVFFAGRRVACAWVLIAASAVVTAGAYGESPGVRHFGRRTTGVREGVVELGGPSASGRFSVEFNNVRAQQVADYIAHVGGCNVVLSEGTDEALTIRFLADTSDEALRKLGRALGASLRREGLKTYRLVKLPRVSLQFDNADVRTVIKQITRLANGNVVIGEEIQGTVSLRVDDVTWRDALDNVVRTAGYQIVEEGDDILRVVTTETLREQRQTRVYQLHYVQPPATYRPKIDTEFAKGGPEDENSIRAFSGTGGAKGATVQRGNRAQFPLLNAVTGVLSPVGRVEYDVFSNSLVVTDISPRLDKVTEVIRLVDVRPAQVFIDVKFVLTSNNDLLDFGTDYQNINGNPNLGFSMDINGGSFATLLPFARGGGWQDAVSLVKNGPPSVKFDPVTGQVTPAGSFITADNSYTFGNLRFNQFLMIMTFLKQDVNSVIMQAPKILTLDNSEATIFVGRSVRYAETFSTSNQAGGVEVGIREADNSPVETGFQLLVVPHIVRGTDDVIIELIPEDEALTGTGTTIPGFDDFSTGQSTIQLPRVSSRTLVTKLRIRSGYTAVLGGLMDERQSDTIRKLPLLGDLPLVGWLFKSRESQKNKSNLVMFITCVIVRDRNDVERVYTVHRQYEAGTVSDVEKLFREQPPEDGSSQASPEESPADAPVEGSAKAM
ncbi:MAG: hypothetical protein V2A58_07650 [Planctomycetota bacterium]